jgi:hypothetical protein
MQMFAKRSLSRQHSAFGLGPTCLSNWCKHRSFTRDMSAAKHSLTAPQHYTFRTTIIRSYLLLGSNSLDSHRDERMDYNLILVGRSSIVAAQATTITLPCSRASSAHVNRTPVHLPPIPMTQRHCAVPVLIQVREK